MNPKLTGQLYDAGFPLREFYDPTLSALIVACDLQCKDFALFSHGISWVCGNYMPYEHDWIVRAEGETPEEAVANLWLALNHK